MLASAHTLPLTRAHARPPLRAWHSGVLKHNRAIALAQAQDPLVIAARCFPAPWDDHVVVDRHRGNLRELFVHELLGTAHHAVIGQDAHDGR